MYKILVLMMIGLLLGQKLSADNSELKFKTEKVVVFKDGYCLIIKKGLAETNAKGEVFTHQVPDSAVLGTFWAFSKDKDLLQMTAGKEEISHKEEIERLCENHLEILLANKGKSCTISTHNNEFLNGTIQEVLVREDTQPVRDNQLNHLGAINLLTKRHGSDFVLKTERGSHLIQVSHISRLIIKGMDLKIKDKHESKSIKKTMSFSFMKKDAGQQKEITMMYFGPGLKWLPTYRIDLNEKTHKAKVNLQAEIINDKEDFIGVPIDIVVGVPNFRFKSSVSPLILENVLRHVTQNNTAFANNMLNSQRVAYASNNSSFTPAGNSSVNLPTEITGGANNDLFIYELKDIDIKKGQRIAVPIFEMMSSYKDVYTWDYHLRRHQSAGATTSSGSVIENTVWHRIELTNESKIPWTTGAALIMQGKQPLAQELLTYTSPGRKVRVGVTIAVSLQPEFKEKEVSREFKNLHFDRYDYCKITNFAELDICNNFNKDAEVEINLFFGGVADKISDKGAATLKPFANEDWEQYHGSPAVNNSTKLIWKAVIKPGESFKPTVQFHYFMRH